MHSPKHHTVPHAFKFELDENGACQMHYKLWASDKEWFLSGEILDGIIPGHPLFLRPMFEKIDLPALRRDIGTCYPCMTGINITKWERDLNALEDRMERWDKLNLMEIPMKRWPLEEFKHYVEIKRPGARSDDDERRMVAIQKNYEKENTLRHVSIHFHFQLSIIIL